MISLDDLIPAAPVGPKFGLHPSGVEWAPAQIAIFEEIVRRTNNILINAVAGSGKTTTIEAGVAFTSPNERIVFLAFNKAIADELARRVPSHVLAKTFHALGFAALRSSGWRGEVDGRKLRTILQEVLPDNALGKDADIDYGAECIKLISHAKSRGMFFETMPTQAAMVEIAQGIEIEEGTYRLPQICNWAAQAFRISVNMTKTIDFDDMLWLPFHMKCNWPTFDRTFVDEVQDLNYIQHLIVQKVSAGQVVAVGDRAQSIYAFRGATPSSMDDMKQMFAMVEFPLSVTYRCARSIVDLAREWVPHLRPRDGAPDGQVIIEPEIPVDLDYFFQNGAIHEPLIICRQNKPLIKLGLRMLGEQRRFTIRSNLEGSLTYFVDTLTKKKDQMPISEFRTILDKWFDEIEKSCHDSGRMGQLAASQDRYDALVALSGDVMVVDVRSLKRLIAQLFAGKDGPLLCTIHKSKGLEADEVVILRPNLIPSKYAKTEVDLVQEYNLLYVARTRAKRILTLMYDPSEES